MNFLFKKVISGAPFFDLRPKAFIVQLVSILRLEHYGPGEIVVRQGDTGTMMYFIAEGQLQVRGKGRRGASVQQERAAC